MNGSLEPFNAGGEITASVAMNLKQRRQYFGDVKVTATFNCFSHARHIAAAFFQSLFQCCELKPLKSRWPLRVIDFFCAHREPHGDAFAPEEGKQKAETDRPARALDGPFRY
ncbi:MAG: hypothetical protein Fues2KO_14350 [Fuerstiella sp.]